MGEPQTKKRKLLLDGGDDQGDGSSMLRIANTTDKIEAYQRLPDGFGTEGPYRIYKTYAQLETSVDGDQRNITNERPNHSLTYFHITIPTPALSPLRFTIKLDQADMDRGQDGNGQGPQPYTGKITFLVDQSLGTREKYPDPVPDQHQISGILKYPYRDEYEPHAGSTDPHASDWEKPDRPGYGLGGGNTSQQKARLQATLERMNDLATNGATPLRIMLSTPTRIGWLPHITPMGNNDIDTGDVDSDYGGTSGFFIFRAIDSTVDNGDPNGQGINGSWVQAATLVSTDGYRAALKAVWKSIGAIATMLDTWKDIFNFNVTRYNSHTHQYVYPTYPAGNASTGGPDATMAQYIPSPDFHTQAQNDYAASWTDDNIK